MVAFALALALLCGDLAVSQANARPTTQPHSSIASHDIASDALGGDRTIRIWIPPLDAGKRPAGVLYLHDAQNLFDPQHAAFGVAWEVDEAMQRLVTDGLVPPLLVVGLDHGGSDRIAELTMTPDPRFGGGRGAAYEQFLIDEVMPFVANEYDIEHDPETTFVGGSSLGGLMSLELLRRHPDRFAGALVMSPSLWWDNARLLEAIEAEPTTFEGTRIWLDIGTAEGGAASRETAVERVRRLGHVLQEAGIAVRVTVDSDHPEHNEAAWSARFPAAMKWLTDATPD